MAREVETPKIFREVLERLERTRRKENGVEFIHGLLVSAFILVSLVGAAIVVEELAHLGVLGRSLLFWSFFLVNLTAFGWFVVRPLLKVVRLLPSADDFVLAQRVGDAFPEVHDQLLNVLQLHGERENPRLRYSVELIDASFTELFAKIHALEFESIITYDRAKRLIRRIGLSAGVLLVVFFLSPSSFISSADRLVHFDEALATPAPFQLLVEPGNAEVVRGETVAVSVSVVGTMPETAALFMKQEGQEDFESVPLKRSALIFQYDVRNIKTSTRYYASSAAVRTDTYTLRVIDRPHIDHLEVSVSPPLYSGLPVRHFEDHVGDVTALRGSRIRVQVSSSKPVGQAGIVFKDSSELPLAVQGDALAASFILEKDGTYHIELVDARGLRNEDPIEYQLKVVPDEYPTVSVLLPGHDVDLTEAMKLNLLVNVRDDFGVSRLRLAYRLSKSRYEMPWPDFRSAAIPLPEGRVTNAEIPYLWDLESFHLVPEDAMSYFLEVEDNDTVAGPKSARSEIYVVRLPSLDEVFADLERSHEGSGETMEEILEEARILRSDLENLSRDVRSNQSKTDWQQQKKAEELQRRYSELTKKIDEVSRTVSEMTEKMEKERFLSPETFQKYMELQQLFEQMDSPELAEAFKRLQQAMQQLSRESMEQALRQLNLSEESFRQSIERTINLFKRIQIEMKVDEILKRTESLLKQQEALEGELMKTDSTDRERLEQLSQKQADLESQLEQVKEQLSELREKMAEFPGEMPIDEVTDLSRQLENQNIDEQMRQAALQMKAGQPQQAMGAQQEAGKKLGEFLVQMQNLQQQLQQNQQREAVNALRRALHDLLELSKRQEGLKGEVGSLDPNSQRFRENAQEQMGLMSDLANVVNALVALSKKSFAVSPEMGKSIGDALREMRNALGALEGRNRALAHQRQTEAMSSLNESAINIANAMQAMMQGKGSALQMFLQRLGQLTQQQMSLNQMTLEQQEGMARLAATQEAIRKSLEQLAREAQASSQSSGIMGDLNKIADEMKSVQEDMEGGALTPETVRKQERILSRLLDSQRSMRERDHERRRQSETASEYTRKSPPELNVSSIEGQNRLRNDLLKAMEEGYSRDYEELIRTYYEALQTLEREQSPQ